ncbi:12312_t:CDS:1, partial [Gigaspora rosea]
TKESDYPTSNYTIQIFQNYFNLLFRGLIVGICSSLKCLHPLEEVFIFLSIKGSTYTKLVFHSGKGSSSNTSRGFPKSICDFHNTHAMAPGQEGYFNHHLQYAMIAGYQQRYDYNYYWLYSDLGG